MLSNQEKINKAINSIRSVIETIEWIYSHNQEAIDGNETLYKDFTEFNTIAKNTIDKLEHPVLSIAMVGTTSAGKSTLVNAFLGRKVAPVEAEEMSAGILQLTHSDKRSLTIRQTDKAKWKTGTFENLSDPEIYKEIERIFNQYHIYGSKIAAPQLVVTGPIEWQTNRSILNLPDNLGVEFIDLPGLKTIQDPMNLSIIQKMLSKAFCIVAMDFSDVDQSRIQRLLDEVKGIVKSLNNNTEFLLFLLNKIDSAKAGEKTVSKKIEELQELIKQTLCLKEQKQIFPFVGLLFYLSQLSVIKDSQNNIVGYNAEYISNIFEDIANVFIQKYKNKEISQQEYLLSDDIKNKILLEEPISIEKFSEFYNLCVRISYADILYAELRRRISESFSHIVIRPTMDDYNKMLTKLLGDVQAYINIGRNSSVLDLLSEKIGMLKSRIYLEGTFDDESYKNSVDSLLGIKETLRALRGIIDNDDDENLYLASRIEKDINKISGIIELRKKGYIQSQIEDINSSIDFIANGLSKLTEESDIIAFLNEQKDNRAFAIFNGMSDIPREISKSLITLYLDPFRGMMTNKESHGAFVEKMSQKMATSLAKEFGNPYETLFNLFYSHFQECTKLTESYYLKTSSPKSNEWQRRAQNDFISSNNRVRDVLSKLTNIEFQKETGSLIGCINEYLQSELNTILQEIQENASINSADISVLLENTLAVSKATINLPNELFTFTTPKVVSDSGREKTGETTKVVEGTCCDDVVIVDVYGDYYTYTFDNEVGCYKRWKAGIDDAVSKFWSIINDWLKKQVSIYMSQIQEAVYQVADMIDQMFDNRLKELQAKKNSDIAKLDVISAKIVSIEEESKKTITE